VVQRLGQQRIGVEHLADARVGPGGRDGFAQRAVRLGVRGDQLRDDDRRQRAGGPPRRGVGEHRPDPSRITAPAVTDPRGARVQGRVVDAEHGRDVSGGTVEGILARARHGQDQSRSPLG
jgi:hypothetical protein